MCCVLSDPSHKEMIGIAMDPVLFMLLHKLQASVNGMGGYQAIHRMNSRVFRTRRL